MKRQDAAAVPLDRLAWAAGVVLGASLTHWSRLPFWIPVLLVVCIAWRFASAYRRSKR